MNPYITFVVAARNDDYGGNFLHRIQIFVSTLATLWEKHNLEAELIIVEWNPPQNKASLKDALNWPHQLEPGAIRIIKVPNEIHNQLPNSDRMPMFEYVAKNVGIRRANGEYVLATNPDLLFSEELVQNFASQQLLPHYFYRIDRYDVQLTVPFDMSAEERLQLCAKNSFRVATSNGTVPISEGFINSWIKNIGRSLSLFLTNGSNSKTQQKPKWLHTNASGDFFLMAKSIWHSLRGYPELKSHSFIDGYICFMAASSGLQQRIMQSPMKIYHIEHDRSEHAKRPLTDYQLFLERGNRMLGLGRPEILNDENWGLGDKQLPEEVI